MKIAHFFFLFLFIACMKSNEINPHISIFPSKIEKVFWAGVDQKKDCNEICKAHCLEFFLGENCFHTCGCVLGSNILFLLLSNGQLFRSTDMGKIWDDESIAFRETFERFTKLNKHLNNYKSNEDLFFLKEIISNPHNPEIIWFIGKTHINWKTDNAGRSYTLWYLERSKGDLAQISSILLHPIKSDGLMATTFTPEACDSFLAESRFDCKQSLYVSYNNTNSWDLLEENVKKFAWGNSGKTVPKVITRYHQHYVFGNMQKIPNEFFNVDWSTVYFSKENEKKREVMVMCNQWSVKLGKSYSKCIQILENIHSFHFYRNYIYLAFWTVEREIKILVSHNLEKYSAVVFSDNSNPHFDYFTFFETQQGVIFLYLSSKDTEHGTLYRSDYTGQRFTKMLPNVHRSHDSLDFIEILSLEGVFLANIVLLHQKGNEVEKLIQTVISYDNGNKWHHLPAPKMDHEGKPILCGYKDQCHLHLALTPLYGKTSSLITTKNAIGVILGLGNLGKELSSDPDSWHPFMSIDGGMTWKTLSYKQFLLAFGDLGSLLLMASHNLELKYSWNFGLNWTTFKIPNMHTETKITRILSHPFSNAQEFLLIGERGDDETSSGVIVLLDFSELKPLQCKSPEDYEIFTPKTYEESCILGRKVSYMRKKPDAECYNGWEFEPIKKQENCECTINDYECDWGFYKLNGACEAISVRLVQTNFSTECYNERKPQYVFSKGYRKVLGNSCVGKTVFDPVLLECPIYFLGLSRNQLFWLFLGILIIVFSWVLYEKRLLIKMTALSLWFEFTNRTEIHKDDIVFNEATFNEEESSDLIYGGNKESP